MIHESRGQYIRVLAYRGEERKEVLVHMVGLLKMMIQQQYVRGTRRFGDYCCYCCCSSPAILHAGGTIMMDFSVLRLERDEWSMVKRFRQATN